MADGAKYEKLHLLKTQKRVVYPNLNTLLLVIHECDTILQLAEVVTQGLYDLFAVEEMRWLEIGFPENRLLWSCVSSETGSIVSWEDIEEEFVSLFQTDGCQGSLFQKVNPKSSELLVLGEFMAEEGSVIFLLGAREVEISADQQESLRYISEHVRRAYTKISRQVSSTNMLRALQQPRVENCLTGVSVLSTDGQKLREVDRVSAELFNRSGAAVKSNQAWVLTDKVRYWIMDAVASNPRSTTKKVSETLSFKKNDEKINLDLVLECTGRGGLLILTSDKVTVDVEVNASSVKNFTRREKQMADLIIGDNTSEEIANIFGISKRTVEKHLENVYLKLGVKNRLAAIKKLKTRRN